MARRLLDVVTRAVSRLVHSLFFRSVEVVGADSPGGTNHADQALRPLETGAAR